MFTAPLAPPPVQCPPTHVPSPAATIATAPKAVTNTNETMPRPMVRLPPEHTSLSRRIPNTWGEQQICIRLFRRVGVEKNIPGHSTCAATRNASADERRRAQHAEVLQVETCARGVSTRVRSAYFGGVESSQMSRLHSTRPELSHGVSTG